MKSDVVQELHALLHDRLFGGGPWLAQGGTCDAVSAKLVELGLEEQISDGSWRALQPLHLPCHVSRLPFLHGPRRLNLQRRQRRR
jgi:hypothetical protein